jgi:hypothetical protein
MSNVIVVAFGGVLVVVVCLLQPVKAASTTIESIVERRMAPASK